MRALAFAASFQVPFTFLLIMLNSGTNFVPKLEINPFTPKDKNSCNNIGNIANITPSSQNEDRKCV